jgi:hypothetical protein
VFLPNGWSNGMDTLKLRLVFKIIGYERYCKEWRAAERSENVRVLLVNQIMEASI